MEKSVDKAKIKWYNIYVNKKNKKSKERKSVKMFSIERTAYCVYKEYYSVNINDEYVKNINNWLRKTYPNVQVEDITEQDIKDCYNQEENQKLEIKLSGHSTLGDFIRDYVEEDIWDSCYDTQYDYMEDYDTYIEE